MLIISVTDNENNRLTRNGSQCNAMQCNAKKKNTHTQRQKRTKNCLNVEWTSDS